MKVTAIPGKIGPSLQHLPSILRHMENHGLISAINIFGLAIGLATCLLIAAYVRDETQFDRYATRAKDIYRVNLGVTGNSTAYYPMVDVAVGPGMAAAYPDIEAFTRDLSPGSHGSPGHRGADHQLPGDPRGHHEPYRKFA